MNRDSGTASANGGWLRRLVRRLGFKLPVRQALGMKYHRLSTEERYELAADGATNKVDLQLFDSQNQMPVLERQR